VPAEAHRYTWRLGPRDRWLMVLASIATVVVVIGILLDGRTSSASTPKTCVGVKSAGFMGGVLTYSCGAKATALCRSEAGKRSDLPKQCARLVPALRP
jgi:hypothetical protein